MSSDFMADRRRGAEEAFFAKQNEALRTQLKATGGQSKQDLSAASGITDPIVLDALVERNVGTEGAAALALIPLVAVAWADGELSDKERSALLKAAEESGLRRDAAGYRLFEGWLDDHPPLTLVERWRDYARELSVSMDGPALTAFRRDVLGKARHVAEAAGGFLGIGAVSAAEEGVLADLERSLS